MTWSIVAHDPATGAFAVTVATANFAVGASCPFVRAGVGAVSTQSMTNRYLGPAILDALQRGIAPAAAIEGALAGDDGAHLRQVNVVDRHGRSAAWTGRHCVEWCGSESAPHVSVAGNMLAGRAVVADTLAAMLGAAGPRLAALPASLPERMIAAMLAGQAAGGDKRGRQSAAMGLVTTEDFPDLDLRVDDHAEPFVELERLLGMWRRDVAPGLGTRPSKANPAGLIDLDAIEAGWKARGLDLRLRR